MLKKILFTIVLINITLLGQGNNAPIDIFIIDSFVSPDVPHMLNVTFFTSERVKSEINFTGNERFIVSDSLSEDHSFSIPINRLKLDSSVVEYSISIFDSTGYKTVSEPFEIYLDDNSYLEIRKKSGGIFNACIGAVTFLIPSPTLVLVDGNSYFSLSKEFPVISFFGAGYNFPKSYVGIEYSYIFGATNSNYLRIGYKYIFETKFIKYISPGINYTTNFNGFNGVSPELSLGLIKFYKTFTLYARYRYNIKPGNSEENFSDFSLGLFTSVISFWM